VTAETASRVRPGDVQPDSGLRHIAHQFEGEGPPSHFLCGIPIGRLLFTSATRVRATANVCPECARIDALS
jgi:hypothetical protein